MVGNKYKLLKTKKHTRELPDGTKVHLIQALKDFGDVKRGDIGGWIEKEENLSQEGNCWVYHNAVVYGNAQVFGDSWVGESARVYGNAWVFGNAQVCGNAWVGEGARIFEDAWVYGNAKVFGNAMLYHGEFSTGKFSEPMTKLGKLAINIKYFDELF